MIHLLKITLFTECVVIIMETCVMASDQTATADLYPVISSEHGDEHFFYIPVDKQHDYFLQKPKFLSPIVRRNDFFYAKNLKTLPRIGRRNDFFLKAANAKNVPRIGRRDEYMVNDRELTSSWPWYKNDNYIPRVIKKNMETEKTQSQASLNKEISELPYQAAI